MILIDPRDGATKRDIAGQMQSIILRLGVTSTLTQIPYGDFCFDGQGPTGTVTIGIERKTLHDMLHCIDDSRYNMQRIGMKHVYAQSVLIVEGYWRPHENGLLMELYPNGSWGFCRYRSKPVLYSKLHNYLISVALSGVVTTLSRDIIQTCTNVVEFYHYFQKPWQSHTSLLEKQVLNVPSFNYRPSLLRRWAAELDGIGVKFGGEAERLFRTPVRLARADETEWVQIEGIGAKTAIKIVKEINGW